ncbi:hypothetical protein AALP_AA8G323400 [Arabis alpina]|uniref:Uncharacterized protein n=1 Tax=Arabis alpina TaxID=50452 RepID=A0A087GAW3_ARAAL|nr:hypothetical protein AALP_AA8G323400 [Arabis alpina]
MNNRRHCQMSTPYFPLPKLPVWNCSIECLCCVAAGKDATNDYE